MGKKNFTKSFDAVLLGEQEKGEKEQSISPNKGTKQVSTSVTIDIDTLEKIRFIAYWERTNIKDVMAKSFNEYITRYEATHGEIKIPNRAN